MVAVPTDDTLMLGTTVLLGQEGPKVEEAESHMKPRMRSMTDPNVYFGNFDLIFRTRGWRSYGHPERPSFGDREDRQPGRG